jgi:ribonucleoside-diphosphate reductase beta chain
MELKELDRIATADLKQLGDIRIDDVLEFLDRGLENVPSYLDLYHRWEKQQWAVSDLDFSPDKAEWQALGKAERPRRIWMNRLFFDGEERVTATLAPFVWAAPSPEIEVFLSTQMVDEARHTIFFERWWREVPGSATDNLHDLIEEIRPTINEGYNELFYERLPSAAQRLASNPSDREAFVEGVTMYHIVIEGTLALTGQRFALETMRDLGQTHFGFYQGFTAVARDESRHVNFGVKVLQEFVREDAGRFAPIIQQTLLTCLPLIAGTIEPPEGDQTYFSDYGRSQDEVQTYAMNALNKRLRAIGINLQA